MTKSSRYITGIAAASFGVLGLFALNFETAVKPADIAGFQKPPSKPHAQNLLELREQSAEWTEWMCPHPKALEL